jgi:hypothetical protein
MGPVRLFVVVLTAMTVLTRTFVYKLSVSILNESYVNNPANTFPEYFSFFYSR